MKTKRNPRYRVEKALVAKWKRVTHAFHRFARTAGLGAGVSTPYWQYVGRLRRLERRFDTLAAKGLFETREAQEVYDDIVPY